MYPLCYHQDLILALKNKIAAHARDSEEQNRRIRDEKEVMLKQLQKLKSEMNRARAKARSNLAKLTMESCATLKVLQRVVKKVTLGALFQVVFVQNPFPLQIQQGNQSTKTDDG